MIGADDAGYPLALDTFESSEVDVIAEIVASRQLTMGSKVAAFEREFADWVGAGDAVMVNSGSSANLLMVDALLRRTGVAAPLRPGDEVLVPSLAWPTTVWPIIQLGLVPVWVDTDERTLGLDLASAAVAVGRRTRAMFLIHPLGRALDMDAYLEFADRHSLIVLEDVCESLGAHWRGRHAGTFGSMGSFSFYFSHHLTTIEGGMIVSDDRRLCDDLRSTRSHGWVRDRKDRADHIAAWPDLDERFLFIIPGYNVRPMEFQGALGSVQLRRLDEMLDARAALAAAVAELLRTHAPWLELIGHELIGNTPLERRARVHSWMTLPMRVREGAPVTRDALVDQLETAGVATRPLLAGNLARHPASASIRSRSAPSLEGSDILLAHAFMIGCHPNVSDEARGTLTRALVGLSEL